MQIRSQTLRRFVRLAPLSLAIAGLTGAGVAAAGVFGNDSLGMASFNPLGRVIPGPEVRWQSTMSAFAAADRERAPINEGVLFVGSSTIRLWSHLSQDFRDHPVINRGFGGSTMADTQYFAKQLVLQYKPRQVLVYAGDNDLAEGRSPQQVLESFRGFVETVRKDLPNTRVSYISIKPSPMRAFLLPKIRETNALISAYVQTVSNSAYIDIFTPMLDASGAPRADFYGPDRLHMNDSGYALWTSIISSYVQPIPGNGSQPANPLAAEAAQPALQAVSSSPAAPAATATTPVVRPPLNVMRAVYRP